MDEAKWLRARLLCHVIYVNIRVSNGVNRVYGVPSCHTDYYHTYDYYLVQDAQHRSNQKYHSSLMGCHHVWPV